MRSKLLGVSLLMCALCLGLAGCGNDGGSSSSGSATPESSLATEKWNAYVDLGNKSGDFLTSIGSYFKCFGTDAEPVVKKSDGIDYFLRNTGGGNFLRRYTVELTGAAAAMSEKPPQSELDQKARAFTKTITPMADCFQETIAYYEAKSNVDDGGVKGKELHTRMLAAYNDLEPAYEAFTAALTEQGNLNMLKDAQDMRDEGMKIVPACLEFIVAARAVDAELERQQLTEETMSRMDTAAFQPYYDDLVKKLAELDAAASDKEQLEKEHLYEDKVAHLASVARELKAAGTSLLERASTGQPILRNGVKSSEGTPEHFNRVLGRMIDAYNLTIQIRKQ